MLYHSKFHRSAHKNDLQSIILTHPASVWPDVQRGSNRSALRRWTVTPPMTWCTRNRYASNQGNILNLSMVQSRCSLVHRTRSWQWVFVNRGTQVRLLLISPISKSVRWNTSISPALNWAILTVRLRFSCINLGRPFTLMMHGRPVFSHLLVVSSFLH